MENIPGYKIITKIHTGNRYIILKGEKVSNLQPVIIKTFHDEFPAPIEILRMTQEKDIVQNLNEIAGIIKVFDYIQYKNNSYLVLEDMNGISLKQYILQKKIETKEFLTIAISLADTLAMIHSKKIIHKNIHTDNIIINPKNGEVKITDFGISAKIKDEIVSYSPTNILDGELAYLSPEQTGRMNRSIDYRSDMYSLGITFYEILSGKTPFEKKDPVELVFHHIAVKQGKVSELNPKAPSIISNIIDKLLEKNVEDRYQSAEGLKRDLRHCLDQLTNKGKIESIILGKKDFSGQFQLQRKLYGRDDEINILMESFNRVCQGSSELVLVYGYSGVGKTALVNEVHKPITEKKGLFVTGKFDQYKRNVPYFAINQALNDLCNYLLCGSENALEQWRLKILEAVGNDGQCLISIIPKLELIIGKQPGHGEMTHQEALNKINAVFFRFIKAISSEDHPLIIFIDDLQWVDSESLYIIKHLITNVECKYMLMILAYRENEVNALHPFIMTLNEIKKTEAAIVEIFLNPLEEEDITYLLADMFYCNLSHALSLSKLIYQRTEGNAFFVVQFLKSLYSEGSITYSCENRKWEWNIEIIKTRNISDNIAALMSRKILNIPEETQKVLRLASCVGNQFDLILLSIIHESDPLQTLKDLWLAVEKGLVYPSDQSYKTNNYNNGDASGTDKKHGQIFFKFIHDRIQEASYEIIDEKDKKLIHYKIGRLLILNTSEEEIDDRIFNIINQYERAFELVTDKNEKIDIAKYCLMALRKAVKSSAFQSALRFANLAVNNFIDESDWKGNYNLTWNLFYHKADLENICVRFDECEQTIKTVLPRSLTNEEKVKIYKIYSNLMFQLNRHIDGINVAKNALSDIGVKMHFNVTKLDIFIQYLIFRLKINFKKPEGLLNIPDIEDKNMFNVCSILYFSIDSSYIVNQNLMMYNTCIMANISLKYGHSIYSAFAYSMMTLIMTGITKEFKLADALSKTSIELNKKYPELDIKGKIHLLYGLFPASYRNPMKEDLSTLYTAYKCIRNTGNIHWENYAYLMSRTQSIFYNNKTLQEVISENLEWYHHFLKTEDREVILCQNNILNFLYWFSGFDKFHTNEKFTYDDETYKKEMDVAGNNVIRTYYYTFNMVREYSLENYTDALEYARVSSKIITEVLGIQTDVMQRFYYLLTVIQNKKSLKLFQRLKLLTTYSINRALLYWCAKNSPYNYNAYYLLIKAEESRLKNKEKLAASLYDESIKAAKETGFLHIQALANELQAKFYLSLNREFIASAYMTQSYKLWKKWGANIKVKNLEEKYQNLISPKHSSGLKDAIITGSTLESIDLSTIIKSTQALSSEFNFEKLLIKILYLSIENAGARRGFIILQSKGKIEVKASAAINPKDIKIEQAKLTDKKGELSEAIVNYVLRNNEHALLDNAADDNQFSQDTYLIRNKPKSILCIPIDYKGKNLGALYLENNLTTNAFTVHNIKILNILLAQAAISIENANLFNNQIIVEEALRESETKWRTLVENAPNTIITVNSNGLIIFINQTLPGYTLEKIRDTCLYDYILDDYQTTVKETINRVFMTGESDTFEMKGIGPNNNEAWYVVSVGPIKRHKKAVLAILIVTDTTERKMAEKILAENKEHLEELVKDRTSKLIAAQEDLLQEEKFATIGKITATVSHELRNPLGTIQASFYYISSVTRGRIHGIEKALNRIERNITRCDEIIEELLDYTRDQETRLTPANLNDWLKEELNVMGLPDDIEIKLDLASDVEVMIDMAKFHRCFKNIIDNAIQAMRDEKKKNEATEKNKKRQLIVKSNIEKNKVEIIIKDTGPGIPVDEITKIFKPLYSTKGFGVGLGLPIAKQIIEQHHGGIKINSVAGKETVVTLWMPIDRV